MTRACTRSIKSRLKFPKLPKYEGKCPLSLWSNNCCEARAICPLSFRFRGVKALLILGNQSFSNMFTSYSHALSFVPAAGLRLEIACNIDKKKSELYFFISVKKFLTKKQNERLPKQQKFTTRAVVNPRRNPRYFLCFSALIMSPRRLHSTCRGS